MLASWASWRGWGLDSLTLSVCLQLELAIDHLPTLQGQFLCAFTALDKTLITNATRKSPGINCTTPRTDLLPSIPPGQREYSASPLRQDLG